MGEKDGEGGRLDRLQWYLKITCKLCFPGPPGLWVPELEVRKFTDLHLASLRGRRSTLGTDTDSDDNRDIFSRREIQGVPSCAGIRKGRGHWRA